MPFHFYHPLQSRSNLWLTRIAISKTFYKRVFIHGNSKFSKIIFLYYFIPSSSVNRQFTMSRREVNIRTYNVSHCLNLEKEIGKR